MKGKTKESLVAPTPSKAKAETFKMKLKPAERTKPTSKKSPVAKPKSRVNAREPSPELAGSSDSESSGSSSGVDTDTDEVLEVNPPGKSSRDVPKSPVKSPIQSPKSKGASPARAQPKPALEKPEESDSDSDDDSEKALSLRKNPVMPDPGESFQLNVRAASTPANRTEMKSPRRDLTATLNDAKAKQSKASEDSDTDTTFDSAEDNDVDSEDEVEAVKSPKSTLADKDEPKVDVDLAEGSRIVLVMTEDDLKQLVERIERACPVLDKFSVRRRSKQIKWNEIAFAQFDADTCRKAWEYLQYKRRMKRNMWEIVHEVKYSLEHDVEKFRKVVLDHSPDCPKRPPGAGGGLSMYAYTMYTNLKENDSSKIDYLKWYRATSQKFASLPESEKRMWQAKSEKVKEKYQKDVADFYASNRNFLPAKPKRRAAVTLPKSATSPGKGRAKSVPKDLYPDAPKPPSNPLETFIQSKLKKIDPAPLPDELEELKVSYGNKWHQLDDSKKAKTIGKVIKGIDEYYRAVEAYKVTHPGYEPPKSHKLHAFLTKSELSLWESSRGRPPKPPASPADVFYHELESKGELDNFDTDIDKRAVSDQKWASLSWYDKENYKLQHMQQSLKYTKEIADYFANLPEFLRPVLIATIDRKYRQAMLNVDQGENVRADDGEVGKAAAKKRKGQNISEEASSSKLSKKKAKETVPPELTNNHILAEIEEAKEDGADINSEEISKKKKKKSKLYDVIRGIFDARQSLGRRYSVFYYYARYAASNKVWIARLEELGLYETALLILRALTQLSEAQKKIFISYSRNFHAERYYAVKHEEYDCNTVMVKKRLKNLCFPGEPEVPPGKPQQLYARDMKLCRRDNPPPWKSLDPHTRRVYQKKLYHLTKEYVRKYEEFVEKMTLNDMIEYVVHRAARWEERWNTGVHVKRAAKGFILPLPTHDLSDDDDYTQPEFEVDTGTCKKGVPEPVFDTRDFLSAVAKGLGAEEEHPEAPGVPEEEVDEMVREGQYGESYESDRSLSHEASDPVMIGEKSKRKKRKKKHRSSS